LAHRRFSAVRVKFSRHSGTGRPVHTLSPPTYGWRESVFFREYLGAVDTVAFPPWLPCKYSVCDTISTIWNHV